MARLRIVWPPTWRQCLRERFIRCVASVLQTASVTPEPIGSFFAAPAVTFQFPQF
jgi:hypothetical protein